MEPPGCRLYLFSGPCLLASKGIGHILPDYGFLRIRAGLGQQARLSISHGLIDTLPGSACFTEQVRCLDTSSQYGPSDTAQHQGCADINDIKVVLLVDWI